MGYNQLEVGARIRKERLKNRLTIEKLCEMLGVSQSFIGLVERGSSGISLENLYKLSEIFKVSSDYLLKGIEMENSSMDHSKTEIINTYLYDYTDEELEFTFELLKFLKPKISVK